MKKSRNIIQITRGKITHDLEDALDLQRNDLCILQRLTTAKKKTFALAIDNGGRQFPKIIGDLSDIPYWQIKEAAELITHAAAVYPEEGLSLDELLQIGREMRSTTETSDNDTSSE